MALFRFGNVDDMFSNMDNMMNQLMGGMFPDPFSMSPFGRGQNLMSPFDQFNQFPNMIQQHSAMPTNGTSFVSSSFISFSSNGSNPTQIYEETKMNHIGPGGVREERHTIRDSRTGLQKMKIGRHIQDKGHVMERSKNHYTGDEEENNEYINIEEEEADEFQQEWCSRMYNKRSGHNGQLPASSRLAITAGPETVQVCSSSNANSNESKIKLKMKQLPVLKSKKSKKPYKKNE